MSSAPIDNFRRLELISQEASFLNEITTVDQALVEEKYLTNLGQIVNQLPCGEAGKIFTPVRSAFDALRVDVIRKTQTVSDSIQEINKVARRALSDINKDAEESWDLLDDKLDDGGAAAAAAAAADQKGAAAASAAQAEEAEWEEIGEEGKELSKVSTLGNAILKQDAFGIESSFREIRRKARENVRRALQGLCREIEAINVPEHYAGELKELPVEMKGELDEVFRAIEEINHDVKEAICLPSTDLKGGGKKAFETQKSAAVHEMLTETKYISEMKKNAENYLLNKLRVAKESQTTQRSKWASKEQKKAMVNSIVQKHNLDWFLSEQS